MQKSRKSRITFPIVNKVTRADLENALLPTIGVGVGLAIAQWSYLREFAGFPVIVMQCVMSVRVKGSYAERFQLLSYVVLILIGTALWGVVSSYHWFNVIIGVVLLAIALTYWRHFFPDDWRSINAPASALYFYTLALKPEITAVGVVFISGVAAIGLQALLWRLWPSAFELHSPLMRLKSLRARKRTRKLDLSLITSISPELWRYTFRLSVLLIISIAIVSHSNRFHAYWIPLTVIIVLQDTHRDTLRRVGARVLGTFVGSIVGSLFLSMHTSAAVETIVLIFCIFTFLLLVKHNYAVACIFLTVYIILLIGRHTENSFTVAIERIFFTMVGGALLLASSYLLFWQRKAK